MPHDVKSSRPLSPHLQIYRWPVTMATSICHRATGVGLYGGTVFLAWWLIAAATSAEAYAVFQTVAASFIGQVILIGYTWALLYHLLNGIRHLTWDTGRGFDNDTAERTGLLVFALSVFLTGLLWVLGTIGSDWL